MSVPTPAVPPKLLRLAPLLATLALAAGPPAPAATSELWGSQGELWTPASRLPDYSFAGYRSAAAPIPSPAVVANVIDFGAVGDGVADDTTAFENAIAAANNGAVLVPAGRYKITRVLYIRKSNLVLRGAGQALTTLVFPKHLTELLGPPPGTAGLESWSWSGGLIWVEGVETTTKLANVAAPADRGSNTLELSSIAGLSVGQTIRLTMTDPDGSLGRHINADQLDAHPTLVGRRLVRFPARIAAINGNTVTLDRPLRLDVRTAWTPEIRSFTGQLEEVGLEGFTLEFPATPYGGHFQEPGFNGIWMDGVANSWVRDITVHNGDSAVMLERSLFSTVANLSLTGAVARRFPTNGTYYTGHHGVQLRRSDDCLVTDFSIATRFYHDLTVEDATGCVFMKGSGVDVNFDHHTYLPYENLFTQINVGLGSRHFSSSGSRNPESAARETLWNVSSTNAVNTLPNPSPSRGLWPQANFVGINTTLATTRDPVNAWIEAIAPASLSPANLYEAQLARRLAPPSVVPRSATWDGGGTGTAGAQGGSGTWDAATTANWWNGSANEAWPAPGGTDDNAVFGGSAGTVTVAASGVVANDITVNTAGYVFTGGPLILNGDSPTIAANHGGNTTNFNEVIAGSSGLAKTGPSTVQLRGANRYQGDTRVLQGTLLIGSGGNRLPVTTRLILGDGANSGTFQMNSRSQQVGGLLTRGTGSSNRVINTNAAASTFTVHLANATDSDLFAGTLGGATANDNNYLFTKSGPGRLILTGDSTYTGLTTISAGTLQIGDDGPSGSTGPANITNHGTLRFDRTGTLAVPNEISGTGALVVDCPSVAGTIELRGDNSFAGNVTLSGGTLGIDRASSLGSGSKSVDMTTGFGSLRFDGDGIVLPATTTLNLSGDITPGRIQNPAGLNTIAGPLNLSIGAGNTLITSEGGALTLAGTITAPAASRTLKLGGASTGDNRITGAIAETPGRVITVEKSGAGTWSLAGPNTHSGPTSVTAGTLRVRHDSALGTTAAATTVHTGAKLQLDGTALEIPEDLTLGTTGTSGAILENLSGDNTLSGNITRSGVLTLFATSGSLTLLGDIGGTTNSLNLQGNGDGEIRGDITSAFAVSKAGDGTWTLSGASTHTGTTTVNAGRLVLSGSLAGPLAVANGTLVLQGSPTSGSSLNLQANGRLEASPGDTLTLATTVTLAGHLDLVPPPGLPAASRHTLLAKSSPGPVAGTFTGKPEGALFTAGGYEWRITYLGGDGNDVVATVLPENAIEQWRQLHFGSSANSGDGADLADPDDDGESNLLEFTTGQDPHAATRAVTSLSAPPAPGFTYTRSRAAFLDGYVFDVEYSDTLAAPWTSVGPGTVTLDAPLQSVHAPIPAGPDGRRFARLRVTAP